MSIISKRLKINGGCYIMNTKIVFEGPLKCSGYTTSPDAMIITNTEEELLAYIEENGLIIPLEDPELT